MPPKQRKKKKGGQDNLTAKELAREYGYGWRFFKSDKELWNLLQDAVKGNWNDQRFLTKFRATKWYKKHSETYRTNYALKFVDPAEYRSRMQQMRDLIDNLAGQWGADLNKRERQRYATRAFLFGWDEAQILDVIAKEVRPDQGHYGGELSGIEQSLREIAYANGVRIGPAQLKGWMRQIVRGKSDSREFETYIRDMAARNFAAFAPEIKGGMNVIDIASPYIQTMAQVLELNPNEIGLDDRSIRRALDFRDKDKNPAPMSITQFEDTLRADKRWQYTDQAREQLKGYAIELGKMWGVMG